MALSTYSFSDIFCVIVPTGYPAATINGQGVGDISFEYDNDNTVHDLAADGSVMISKIKADNGTISVSVQQTSKLHKWFKGWFNFLNLSTAPFWAATTLNLSSPGGLGDIINAVGISPAKRANSPYQAQGQMVTWTLKAGRIDLAFSGLGTSVNSII